MNNPTITPPPPALPGLTWRQVDRDDLGVLVDLAHTCLVADGGLGFLFEPDALTDRYFSDTPGARIGAFAPDRRLVACAAVHLDGDSGDQRAIIVGQVRPDQRSQGIGDYLMRWSQAQAQSLLARAPGKQLVLQISTESLTEPADRLYHAHGFQRVDESLVMRRDLRLPLPDCHLPPGITLAIWQPDLAEQFFQAYHAAFRDRPGFPSWSAAEWITRVTGNDLIPDWSLLVRAADVPLGFIIGCVDLTTAPPGGFVWQVGVIPTHRRRGLASALLVETMRRMQAAGSPSAELTVHLNNPGAIQAYARLGFTTIGRRARYERTAGS
ncbi:MAG: GNAT family N-acetyltransferase [Chloroflexota bacterium]